MSHHRTSVITWKSILLTLAAATLALSASVSAAASPVVVELFTSQGCSSCPPADALLGELARKPNIVALAWHVNYWDDLGWKDRFAIPESVPRQLGYTRKMSREGAFTPQAVISGDTSVLGSDRGAMNRALAEQRDALAVVLSREGANLRIDLPERWREPMDVCAISYLDQAITQVGRGENANRSLKEFHIVRSFKRVGTWNGTPQKMTVPLASLPKDGVSQGPSARPRRGGSHQIEAVQVHHLVPGRHEVIDELLLRVRASIDLGQ
jgi:hypothetical protein